MTPQNAKQLSADALRWVENTVGRGTTVQSVHTLKGATSSAVYRVAVENATRGFNVILRLFTNADWLADEPDLAKHEAASLQKAAEANVPTPELIAYDETGEFCGLPAVLMTELPGRIELKPVDFDHWLSKLAETLIAVHALDGSSFPWRYFSWNDFSDLRPPSWSRQPSTLWEKAIEKVLEPEPTGQEAFLHRDYHPVNVLWQKTEISGIVDWVNACHGPRCVDLAHCRANLVALYGVGAADRFLAAYQSLAEPGFEYHPYWDLTNLVGNGDEPDIYPPWIEFGMTHLTVELRKARTDEFLVSVMRRL